MGLVITGGTTITSGQDVSIDSFTLDGGAGDVQLTASGLDDITAALGAGAILRLKVSSGGTTLVDLPLNTGASGPFDAAAGSAPAEADLDVAPAIEATATGSGVCGYYELRTSGGAVKLFGTDVS
jgi:hypothetical protein